MFKCLNHYYSQYRLFNFWSEAHASAGSFELDRLALSFFLVVSVSFKLETILTDILFYELTETLR